MRDFHQDDDEATLAINEKGSRHRTIGIHLAAQPMSEASMYRVVADYLSKLAGAVKEGERIFSTHSLRATTTTCSSTPAP